MSQHSSSRKTWSCAAAFAASATLVGAIATPAFAATVPAAAGSTTTIQILSFNDFHGRLSQTSSEAGVSAMIGTADALRAQNPNTLLLSAGDNISGSTFTSNIQEDSPSIEALGVGGLDASAVGNHEFDRGFADLTGRVINEYATASGKTGADFALGANVYQKGTTTPALKEYTIREVDGVKVGIVGVVTPTTATMVSPTGISGIEFGDMLSAANRVSAQLSDGNPANGEADVVVLLAHDGSDSEDCGVIGAQAGAYGDLIRGASANVDLIVSGHTHKTYSCELPKPGGGTRPVIQQGEYSNKLGQTNLVVDTATKQLVSAQSAILATNRYATNASVASIVSAAEAQANVLGARPVGKISGDITRGGTAGSDRGVESTAGNSVADWYLWATQQPTFGGSPAQIGIMNPGGLRADILYTGDGTVTYKNVADVQPFANSLVTMDLTGAQLREILELQWQPAGASRPKLHLGISDGFSYEYVEAADPMNHIKKMYFNGKKIKDSDVFRVVTNSFVAGGGDGFTPFADGTNRADTGVVDLKATVDYFEAHPVVAPAPLGRAIAVTTATNDPGTNNGASNKGNGKGASNGGSNNGGSNNGNGKGSNNGGTNNGGTNNGKNGKNG